MAELTGQQLEAALLVAADRLTNKQIAEKVGISERQLLYWKTETDFKRAVDEHLQAWMRDLYGKGIADRRRRVFQLNDRWRKAQAIAQARAKDPSTRRLPGGNTGFLVRRLRSIRRADGGFAIIEEGKFDSALFRDLLALEEQAARELGQWDVKQERVVRRLTDLSREEVDALMLDISKTYGLPMPTADSPASPPA